jgi:hypothetical protein
MERLGRLTAQRLRKHQPFPPPTKASGNGQQWGVKHMGLAQRINDRREANEKIVPLIERRGGSERRVPRWIEWTRENDNRGKSLDERAA